MKKSYIVLLIGLFLIVLNSSRILWMETFSNQAEVIENGQTDLREWDARQGDVLLLDGEWEFYPFQWLIDEGEKADRTSGEKGPKFIHVPGGWNEALDEEQPTPYGFGSYRLRIYVNPEQQLNYSVRIPSVRTASQLYVNGRLLAESGQVASVEEDYMAKNLPYTTTFTADENGIIELVLQAANYTDSRNSGIARSIKFGSEEAIARDMKFSISMQLVGTVIFLMHSMYAFILYLLGNRERQLLYFSLLTISVTITSLLSNDEKLFHQLFYIGIDWDFRLANAIFMLGFYALLECSEHRELPFWNRIFPVFRAISLGVVGLTLFLTPDQIISLFPVYFITAAITTVITVISIFKTIIQDIKGHLLLLFSLLAMVQHFLWTLIWRESGMNLVHYPFDLIIAMGCFASVWFKNYFNIHASTKELASTLQRMNDHKDQFLANTSHEFKNPLHGILNLSEAVLKREQNLLQERSVKELETVLSVGRRMTLILNDLIDVMSLREGNPRLQKKTIRIQPIVTGVIDMLQLNAEMKRIAIVNQIPDNFPPVFADENRVVQIVFNLLHNAVKYTNEGLITLQALEREGRAVIVISDTGIGMDENTLKRIFLPYEQANTNETMIEGGLGLGLSISKQLIELHGGTLEVSSELGQGSEFTFSLMLADLEAEAEGLDAEEPGTFTEPIRQADLPQGTFAVMPTMGIASPVKQAPLLEMERNRPLILMVDDDPVNLQVMEAILPPEDYDVTLVTSGREALAMLDAKEWDLVISDIMMPQMSGYELTRIIRERFTLTELPVLLLTARNQLQDIETGFLAGANDYVSKPVEALELRARIEVLTTIKQSVKEQLRLEAAWLQAQIQPHFLYNALNTVAALSEFDMQKMHGLLNELSNFLRNKFQFQNMDELISLEEELGLVRSYLYIEQVRFEERLNVVWEIDDGEDVKVPFLSIQPLVENAIKHGIMKHSSGGTIHIRAVVEETYAKISVEDDGEGMDETQLQTVLERKIDSRSGVGLINTDQRLKRHFGTGLHFTSAPGAGMTVSFTVPRSGSRKT